MPGYEDLDTLIGQLKRSAIIASLRPEPWMEINGQLVRSVGSDQETVSLPGEDGEGGGVWIRIYAGGLGATLVGPHEVNDEYIQRFDRVRAEIDDLLRPWRTLPDPGAVENVVATCRQAERFLATSPRTVEGRGIPAGDITRSLNLIDESLDDMTGEAMDQLKQGFLPQLRVTVDNYRELAKLRGSSVQAQVEMWKTSRSHVATIVNDARSAMDEIAAHSSLDWSMVFTVIAAAVEGAKAFMSGGVTGVLTLTQLSAKLLGGIGNDAKDGTEKAKPQSYDDAIASMASMLKKLNTQIVTVEKEISELLAENVGLVRGDRTPYDPEALGVDSGDRTIKYDAAQLRGVAVRSLPAVATELELAASHSLDCSTFDAVYRDGSLGIGANGPSSSLAEFNWLCYELAKQLAWEVTNVAENLRLALLVIVDQETQFKDRLDDIARKIEGGSPYDPWDSTRPQWGSPGMPAHHRPRMRNGPS